MSRELPEWIGKSDDSRPPPRVRVRVFERYDGRCYLTGRKIRPGDKWDLEHIKALINGGANRESNMAPVLAGAVHQEKTARDVAEKSKVYAVKAKHLGIGKSKVPIRGWKRFDGTPVFAKRRGVERR